MTMDSTAKVLAGMAGQLEAAVSNLHRTADLIVEGLNSRQGLALAEVSERGETARALLELATAWRAECEAPR